MQKGKLEKNGKTLELDELLVMHFGGGQISEMWYVATDQAALDAWIG